MYVYNLEQSIFYLKVPSSAPKCGQDHPVLHKIKLGLVFGEIDTQTYKFVFQNQNTKYRKKKKKAKRKMQNIEFSTKFKDFFHILCLLYKNSTVNINIILKQWPTFIIEHYLPFFYILNIK